MSKVDEPIELPPFTVTEPAPSHWDLSFEGLNHAFDGAFPGLRSGALIEAILWRHRYLHDHPKERAVVVTVSREGRVTSATSVYTSMGRVFASSDALGEKYALKPPVTVDLSDTDNIRRAEEQIDGIRMELLNWNSSILGVDQISETGSVPGGHSSLTDINGEYLPSFAGALVEAEETGNYGALASAAGEKPPPAMTYRRGLPSSGFDMTRDLQRTELQGFRTPNDETLQWTYAALHNPKRAGVIPVALSTVPDPRGTTGNMIRALVFDWGGFHYVYHPSRGTFGTPFPRNPITDQCYLCVRNGAFLESVAFSAAYLNEHPKEKVLILPASPGTAFFSLGDRVGVFGLTLDPMILPKPFGPDLLNNPEELVHLHDRLDRELASVWANSSPRSAARPIPTQEEGDDADCEIRRAFLGLQAAHVASHLTLGEHPVLTFSWEGLHYSYSNDQVVRRIN